MVVRMVLWWPQHCAFGNVLQTWQSSCGVEYFASVHNMQYGAKNAKVNRGGAVPLPKISGTTPVFSIPEEGQKVWIPSTSSNIFWSEMSYDNLAKMYLGRHHELKPVPPPMMNLHQLFNHIKTTLELDGFTCRDNLCSCGVVIAWIYWQIESPTQLLTFWSLLAQRTQDWYCALIKLCRLLVDYTWKWKADRHRPWLFCSYQLYKSWYWWFMYPLC